MKHFYAHSGNNPDKSDWQTLESHLRQVAQTAKGFAAVFKAGSWGAMAGWLHDAGKATQAFQLRLEGDPARVDHSTFGARMALENAGPLGPLLAYVIAGHHGGLPDGGSQEKELHYRIKHGKVPSDAALLPVANLKEDLVPPFKELPKGIAGFRLAFFTRMIFSCLVDADFLDTEAFCSPEKTRARKAAEKPADAEYRQLLTMKEKLDAHLNKVCRTAKKTPVNQLRQKILRQCRDKAKSSRQIFSLSVPTGGGKTFSSLAFALDHALFNNLRRVIYAIPFTSIIEQNAGVFRDILGQEQVLEHHCNYKERDDFEGGAYDQWRGLAVENWDASIVVTTNVQFFESLFSHKPSRCRKLHNIAGSVIVLDEAQAVPTEYLEPCLAVLNELVEHYRCSVVLCTATQPAVDDSSNLRTALPRVNEIVGHPRELYRDLQRTQVHFVGELSDAQLTARLKKQRQVLCITATKPQARTLYEGVEQTDGVYHLSTNMYPMHRRRALEKIRGRLRASLACRVISTSLVEAGVDLDFPVVFRAMAGLDSIAQAAGRCNREGKLQEGGVPCLGQVYIYEPEDAPSMPWLKRCSSRSKEVLRNLLPDADPIGLDAMRRYFELLYDIQETDRKQILKRFPSRQQLTQELIFPFREVGEDFRFIENGTIGVIVPMEPKARKLVETLRHAEVPRMVLRKLQQYTVSLRLDEYTALQRAGAVELIKDQVPVLCNLNAYHGDVGLCVDQADVWDVDGLIL